MSRIEQKPGLSLGNRIYLYRLLKEAIGCGKQTLLPAVEKALEAERLGALDLGFESTRALMEALDDCVQLTVFKGGRIYATVIPQPAWDEALAATPAADKGGKPTKSFKKKRADKTLKAVKPKRVKRPEPKPEPKQEPKPEPKPAAEEEPTKLVDEEPGASETDERNAATVSAAELESEALLTVEDPKPQAEDEDNEEATASEEQSAEPAISLTVVYDPEHANDGVKTLASTPVSESKPKETEPEAQLEAEPAPEPKIEPERPTEQPAVDKAANTGAAVPAEAAVPEAAVPAPVAQPAPAPAAPAIPEGYPTDFPAEVYCPGNILAQLAALLPYGADAMGIAGEYYWIARENGSINAARNRASFPLRYTYEGKRHEATIRLRRNAAGNGATWAIDQVTPVE